MFIADSIRTSLFCTPKGRLTEIGRSELRRSRYVLVNTSKWILIAGWFLILSLLGKLEELTIAPEWSVNLGLLPLVVWIAASVVVGLGAPLALSGAFLLWLMSPLSAAPSTQQHSVSVCCSLVVVCVIVARIFGLRVGLSAEASSSIHGGQLSIRQWVASTAIISLALASSRWPAPTWSGMDSDAFWFHVRWPALVIPLLIASGLLVLGRSPWILKLTLMLLILGLALAALLLSTEMEWSSQAIVTAEVLTALGWMLVTFGFCRLLGLELQASSRTWYFSSNKALSGELKDG